jgi:hypothetical protein
MQYWGHLCWNDGRRLAEIQAWLNGLCLMWEAWAKVEALQPEWHKSLTNMIKETVIRWMKLVCVMLNLKAKCFSNASPSQIHCNSLKYLVSWSLMPQVWGQLDHGIPQRGHGHSWGWGRWAPLENCLTACSGGKAKVRGLWFAYYTGNLHSNSNWKRQKKILQWRF